MYVLVCFDRWKYLLQNLISDHLSRWGEKPFKTMLCLSFPPCCFITNWLKKINWNALSPAPNQWPPFFLTSSLPPCFDLWAGGWAVNHQEAAFCDFPQWEKKSFGYCGGTRGRACPCSLGDSICHILQVCHSRIQLIPNLCKFGGTLAWGDHCVIWQERPLL